MGLFRRNRPKPPRLASPPAKLGYSSYSYHRSDSAGCDCAYAAYQSAKATADKLSDYGDLSSLVETVAAVYAIAEKLEGVDKALCAASSELLRNALYRQWPYSGRADRDHAPDGGEAETVTMKRKQIAEQNQAIENWARQQSEAKRRWLSEVVALRGQIAECLLQALGNVLAIAQETDFRQGVLKAQQALGPLQALDVEGELLTTKGEAEKARALAEAVLELDLPQIQALGAGPA